jgi:hypothetical protein
MMVIDLNGDGNLLDEFNAGTYWVNLNTSVSPLLRLLLVYIILDKETH